MTTPDEVPGGRFRRGTVIDSTPEQRLEALLEDGAQMYATYEDLLRDAGQAGDVDLIGRLADIAATAPDVQRAYAAQRLAASLLLAIAATSTRDDDRWAAPLDETVRLLVAWLDRTPHEPELLLQLAAATMELGDLTLARRIMGVVRDLVPEHEEARRVLRRCERLQQGSGTATQVDASAAPVLARQRTLIRSILERAMRLEARTISVCMIVKDEEELLPGCLEAIAPFVDQLVVVDTGSVDSTREIATGFGATLVEFPWNGSFSDARNESLRHATGDWILWLDADEHLVVEDGPRLRELARRTWLEGISIVETHQLGAGEGETASHTPIRMFRRRPEYVWRGTIHEQVAWALPTWLPGRIHESTVRVDHYGYMATVIEDRGKRERNLEMLMAQVEEERTAFTCFNIGTEHAALGDWQTAHTWFESSLALVEHEDPSWRTHQWAPILVDRAARARRATGDVAATIAIVDSGLETWPDYTDLVFERALAHADAGDWEACAADCERATRLGDAPARYVAVRGKGTFQARRLWASALRHRMDLDGAVEQLTAALAAAPHALDALTDLVDVELERGDDARAVSDAVDALLGARADATQPNLAVGAAFHERGELELAQERYDRALAATPGTAAAHVARAELMLARGELREAWEEALRVDVLDPLSGPGAMTAFLAAAALGDPALVAAPAERIARSQSMPVSERSVYVAWRQLLAPGEGIHALVPSGDDAAELLLRNLEALARIEATDAFEQLHSLVEQVVPDERERRLRLADLYLRLHFADLAGEELMVVAQQFGPDATILTGLGRVATIKQMWEDAEVFLSESLQLDPAQPDAARLLEAVRERNAG